jgi:hypothetical protein
MKMLKSTLAVATAAAVLGVSGFAQAGATLDGGTEERFRNSAASAMACRASRFQTPPAKSSVSMLITAVL